MHLDWWLLACTKWVVNMLFQICSSSFVVMDVSINADLQNGIICVSVLVKAWKSFSGASKAERRTSITSANEHFEIPVFWM